MNKDLGQGGYGDSTALSSQDGQKGGREGWKKLFDYARSRTVLQLSVL